MKRPTNACFINNKWLWLIGLPLVLGVGGAAWWTITALWPKPLTLPAGTVISGKITNLTPAPYRIGDLIALSLEIKARDGVSYSMPDLATNGLGKLELKTKTGPQTIRYRGGCGQKIQYTLTSWETGLVTIPALQFKYRSKESKTARATIPAYKIKITSVLPKGKSKAELLALKLKGPKPPVSLPADYHPLWYLAAAAGVALVWFLIYRWRKFRSRPDGPETAASVIREPAHVIALRRLQALKEKNYPQQGNFKAYYTELSECLRQYMEDRFQVNALEMTTEEFCNYLAGRQLLPDSCRQPLQKFLVAADLIKFAKHVPEPTQAAESWEQVYQIVDRTKPEPVETIAATDKLETVVSS
jgi:hypothetical protein